MSQQGLSNRVLTQTNRLRQKPFTITVKSTYNQSQSSLSHTKIEDPLQKMKFEQLTKIRIGVGELPKSSLNCSKKNDINIFHRHLLYILFLNLLLNLWTHIEFHKFNREFKYVYHFYKNYLLVMLSHFNV